jgi:hypothetical protein
MGGGGLSRQKHTNKVYCTGASVVRITDKKWQMHAEIKNMFYCNLWFTNLLSGGEAILTYCA